MSEQNDKQPQNLPTEFAAESTASIHKTPAEKDSTKGDSSQALSKDATESAESKGKKAAGPIRPLMPRTDAKMDFSNIGPALSPEPIAEQPREAPQPAPNMRPGSIYDLVNQANQAPAPEVAPMPTIGYPTRPEAQNENAIPRAQETMLATGNWNSPNFVNPLPLIAAADEALNKNDVKLIFENLAKAQAAADLITPDNVRVILNDLEKLKRDLPQELDSTKRAQMQERVALGTQILDSRWETPLRLSFAMFSIGSADGQAPAEAFRLLQEAARIHPEIKDDPEVKKAMENSANRYGNMAQAMEQAVVFGAQTAGQTAQERSEFQKDPALVQKLAEQGRLAQLDSPDPYVHAQEAQVLMKSQGVLSQEARQEHDRAIQLAKKIENARKESFNSVLAEIGKTKTDITDKQLALAKLEEQIKALKKESKSITTEVAAICATRAEEEKKGHSANMLEAAGSIFNRQLKEWNGDAAKEEKDYQGRMGELSKRGNELRKLESQRKSLEGEIKTSESSLKDKQAKLSEIGKPIVEKHMAYAKALLQDVDARVESTIKALAERNKEEYDKSQDLLLKDIVTASQQLNRAEKISPELANNEEIKTLKDKYQFVSTSITENIKDLNPDLQQQLDDRFLHAVNTYNQHRTEQMKQIIAAGGKPTDRQVEAIKELVQLATYVPELQENTKLKAAVSLIARGETITDEALLERSTIESKALKLNENLQVGLGAMQQFDALMVKKQYKDAEEVLKIGLENLKPLVKDKHEQLNKTTLDLQNCKDLAEMVGIRQQKEGLEQEIAAAEAKILNSIGALYLTSDKTPEKQEAGTATQQPGPGYKPEQALQALKQAKEAFPGIEKNPLYLAQLQDAKGLIKETEDLVIKARGEAEKAKEAGIDLATTGTSWAAAAGAGAAATAGLVGAGILVAGAPVTVPVALAIVGITVAAGAATGALTKWGLANALDAHDKDFASNASKGAFIGGTTGLGGGGLKVGGMVLSEGLALSRTGGTIYQGVKLADVANKVKTFTPLTEKIIRASSTATRIESAAGNVAHEVQLGNQILLEKLAEGKISQTAFNTATQALSKQGLTAGETANVLEWVGIPMKEEIAQLTAAGLRFKAAAGAGGTKAIDAGFDALKAGLPQANVGTYKWNVLGHAWNGGLKAVNQVSNMSKLAAYSTPYVATRTVMAGIPLAAATGTYNAGKYGSKFAAGEINESTKEKWTAAEAASTALSSTAIETGIGLASMGVLHGVSRSPSMTVDVASGGFASPIAWGANKLTGGAFNKAGSKIGSMGPVATARTFFTDTLRYDNSGMIAPLARNILPLSAGAAGSFKMAQDESTRKANILASSQSSLENYKSEVASQEEMPKQTPAEQVASQQKEAKPATAETSYPKVANDDAAATNSNQATKAADDADAQPQPLSDG